MHAPQIIMALLFIIILINATIHHGEKQGAYNAWATLIGLCMYTAILWWGGFWTN